MHPLTWLSISKWLLPWPWMARAFWKGVRSGSLSVTLGTGDRFGEPLSECYRELTLLRGGECLWFFPGGWVLPQRKPISSSRRMCLRLFFAHVIISLSLLLYPSCNPSSKLFFWASMASAMQKKTIVGIQFTSIEIKLWVVLVYLLISLLVYLLKELGLLASVSYYCNAATF